MLMQQTDSISSPLPQVIEHQAEALQPTVTEVSQPSTVTAADTMAHTAPPKIAAAPKPVQQLDSLELLAQQRLVGPKPLSQADSIALASKSFVPDITKAREIVYTPIEDEDEEAEAELTPSASWETGLEGIPRPVYVGDNSGVLAVIAGISILMMLSYRHCRRLFMVMVQELWGMRHRANVFDEHTSNESRVVALMALQWCICTGLLLYSGLTLAGCSLLPGNAFVDTGKLIGLMAVYYLFQLAAYNTVGYTFAGNTGRRLWLQGFTASQSLLGFALIVPALVAIFYPNAAEIAVIVGTSLYFLARIVFIAKGFRIFYTNFGSLLYFILYLCTLEIVPVIFVYIFALFLVNSL